MQLDAIFFDLDGTLVDSNRVHLEAWIDVFRERGHDVRPARIAKEIGKGGDVLVRSILGERASARDVREMPERESRLFRTLASSRRILVYPGALDLLRAVRARGLKTALATSSQKQMLGALFASTRIDLRDEVDVTITADDVDRAKPEPDALHAAARELGVELACSVMVGDTAHDVRAAERAGIPSIGLATSAWMEEELLAAGASSAWRSPAELLARLDEALARVRRTAHARDRLENGTPTAAARAPRPAAKARTRASRGSKAPEPRRKPGARRAPQRKVRRRASS